jgi:hypothetical protein
MFYYIQKHKNIHYWLIILPYYILKQHNPITNKGVYAYIFTIIIYAMVSLHLGMYLGAQMLQSLLLGFQQTIKK